MKPLPLFCDGEIEFEAIGAALKAAGFHVRMAGHQIIVSRVPAFLRRDYREVFKSVIEQTEGIAGRSTVVSLPARLRIKGGQR